MKKQLLWGMLLFMAGFSSCQKDSFKPAATSNPTPVKVKTNTTNPTYRYVDLVLQPRQPGENFDTYTAQGYGPAPIIVTGTPSWNSDMYPVLQNGVPGVQSGISAATGYNSSVVNDPSSGSFVMTTGTYTGFNAALFRSDVGSYNTAEATYEKQFLSGQVPAGTLPPMIWNYVNKTYDQPGIITTTGKIIRVTTGSHWAVATIDYPTPKPITSTVTIPNIDFQVTDPNHTSDTYFLKGVNGIISNGTLRNAPIQATGSYTHTNGTGIYHYQGRIYRSDGTSFDFDITQDLS